MKISDLLTYLLFIYDGTWVDSGGEKKHVNNIYFGNQVNRIYWLIEFRERGIIIKSPHLDFLSTFSDSFIYHDGEDQQQGIRISLGYRMG